MVPELERTVAELVRQVQHRYYGKYRGVVVENADPEQLGRVKAQVPSVLGDQVVTGWALPCVPFGGMGGQGLLAVPEKGAGVWVAFEEGDLEFPIWLGTFWSKPAGKTEMPQANGPDGKQTGVPTSPTRRILKTSRGHSIQIEDADGKDMILIHEAINRHTIVLNSHGIKITDGSGNYLEMTANKFIVHSKRAFTIDAPGQAVKIVASSIDFIEG